MTPERVETELDTPWLEGEFTFERGQWPTKLRYYKTPDGDLPSVTTVLKVLGLGTEALIKWSGDTERKASLDVCSRLHEEMGRKGEVLGAENFALLAEKRMGEGRKHLRELNKAAEIGTQIHKLVEWNIVKMLGEVDPGPEPKTDREEVVWAVMAWQDWVRQSGLKPLRHEQPVWWPGDETCGGYAGTLDSLWQREDGAIVLADLKSSKGIYLEQHLQLMAYLKAARRHLPIEGAFIVRVPKKLDDPAFEVRDMGHHVAWNGPERHFSEVELMQAFSGARTAFEILMAADE